MVAILNVYIDILSISNEIFNKHTETSLEISEHWFR